MWSTQVDRLAKYGFQRASRAGNGRSSRTPSCGSCHVFLLWAEGRRVFHAGLSFDRIFWGVCDYFLYGFAVSNRPQCAPTPPLKYELTEWLASSPCFSILTVSKTHPLIHILLVQPQASQAHVSRKSKRLIRERVTHCVTRCKVTRGAFGNLNAI